VTTKLNNWVLLTCALTCVLTFSLAWSDQAQQSSKHTYILVHGSSGGGWDWHTMDTILTSRGHTVYRPTLTGLGERVHLANANIDLNTHISDIVNTIVFEELDQVILVGHSYAGMVITGVMNRIPERIKHAVFLDAAVPEHGMSALDLWPSLSEHAVIEGQVYFSWLQKDSVPPHDVPQSLKTLTQAVEFNNPLAIALPATYIALVESLSAESAEIQKDLSWQTAEARNWPIQRLISDHNAQRSHPNQLADLLESIIK